MATITVFNRLVIIIESIIFICCKTSQGKNQNWLTSRAKKKKKKKWTNGKGNIKDGRCENDW